jgi:hypothetical protein
MPVTQQDVMIKGFHVEQYIIHLLKWENIKCSMPYKELFKFF